MLRLIPLKDYSISKIIKSDFTDIDAILEHKYHKRQVLAKLKDSLLSLDDIKKYKRYMKEYETTGFLLLTTHEIKEDVAKYAQNIKGFWLFGSEYSFMPKF